MVDIINKLNRFGFRFFRFRFFRFRFFRFLYFRFPSFLHPFLNIWNVFYLWGKYAHFNIFYFQFKHTEQHGVLRCIDFHTVKNIDFNFMWGMKDMFAQENGNGMN